MTKERKEVFFETVKEAYIAFKKEMFGHSVSEGTRWYDEKTGKMDMVYGQF